MNVAIIAPTELMKEFCSGRHYHLLLAHLADDQAYVEAAKALPGYKILDNSLMERGHQAMSLEEVVRAADILGADEIVLPDVFKDGEETINAAAESLDALQDMGALQRFRVAGVAQGATPELWLSCYRWMADDMRIHAIHIPKVMDTIWPTQRAGLLSFLDCWTWRSRLQEHHLLGIWTNPAELLHCTRYSWIRGVDTALPIHAGLAGVTFNPRYGLPLGTKKPTRPDGYFDIKWDDLTYQQIIDIDENIRVLDNMAGGFVP